MAAKKLPPPIQIYDGTWYAVAFGEQPFVEECCDCGLTHRVEYKLENGKFLVRYFADSKLTRRARASRKES